MSSQEEIKKIAPTVLVHKFRLAAGEEVDQSFNHYKGFRVHALEGLHLFVADYVKRAVPAGGALLDVAAGSGAMSLRLLDAGYRVTAIDIVAEGFQLGERVPFHCADLNAPFARKLNSCFDGIIAAEIIEHLENPRHFLRECFNLLSPGGKLLLTTPNLESPVSKAMFVRYGTSQWFSDRDYECEGHITPVSRTQIHRCAAEIGFNLNWEGSYGDPYRQVRGWAKMRWLARIIEWLSNTGSDMAGEVFVAVLSKPGA